jgi:glutamate formiminotransferase/formiminotetrahydrofolate cyclodeaminase
MTLDRLRVDELLAEVGAKSPTPGGGAVASVTAALAAALGRMVVNYSVGKPSLAEHDALHQAALEALADHARSALRLAHADSEAYGRLHALGKLDQDDERRTREWPGAVEAAIDAPRQVISECLAMLKLFDRLLGAAIPRLGTDLAVAAVLAEAAARAAAWNVHANLALLSEAGAARQTEAETARLLEQVRRLSETIEQRCAAGASA